VFLLKSKNKNEISLELLKEFLALKVFYLRLILIKDQFYRPDTLTARFAVSTTKTTALVYLTILLSSQVKYFVFLNERLTS